MVTRKPLFLLLKIVAALALLAVAAIPAMAEPVSQGQPLPSSLSWPITPVQGPTLLNSSTTSAANAVNTVTLSGVAGKRIHVYRIGAYCSAGTSTLTITDGAATIFVSPTGAVTTAVFLQGVPFNVGLSGTTGNTVTISLATCGVGNTGTLNIEADVF